MDSISKQIAGLSPEKRELLERMLEKEGVDLSRSIIVPRKGDLEGLPLSFAQQRLWFLNQLVPGSAFYNVPGSIRIKGRMSFKALERSLNEIVRRHESLRTTFPAVDGKPLQVIADSVKVCLPMVDLRDVPDERRDMEARRLAVEEARAAFDLECAPLLRTRLVRLRDDEQLLLLNMHHIVSDGWSMGVFIRELTALYEAFSEGRPSPLPDLSIQYADFAVWQQEWLRDEVLEKQLTYWKHRLEGSPAVLELPADHPRPPVQTYNGAYFNFMFPTAVCESLARFNRGEGVTPFMTLLAAFKALLHRYTGEDDIIVGTPIANRNRSEIEDLIGFFVNTLVLRSSVQDGSTFRELVRQVREIALGAFAYQDLPFEKLVEELQPERDLSHTPLVQVVFAMQNAPRAALKMKGLEMLPLDADSGSTRFELALHVWGDTTRKPPYLVGYFIYNTDIFVGDTIRRMAGHYMRMLGGMLEEPDRRIGEVSLMDGYERERVVVEWSGGRGEYPEGVSFNDLYEGRVKREPGAVAVVGEGVLLGHGELYGYAGRLARYLCDLGVGLEDRVGVYAGRSVELLVGVLGILRAGGAFVPLDPSYPADRIRYMVADSGVSVVLVGGEAGDGLPEGYFGDGVRVVSLEGVWDDRWGCGDGVDGVGVLAGNAAYVMYTSGSTGDPKGVVVEHGSMVNYLWWVGGHVLEGGKVRVPVVSSLSFDASLKQLLGPLVAGGVVWLVSGGVEREPGRLLADVCGGEGEVGLNCVPSLWRVMLDGVESGEFEVSGCGLRRLYLGGEELDAGLVERTFAVFPGLEVWNLYGPTEATANVVVGRVRGGGRVVIGRPILNVCVYVLDGSMRPVPVGVPGELYVGGVCVARGYSGRADLTAECFVPDPFGTDGGGRLYRTGDVVRWLPGGELEYLGRRDDQVKLRGYRIELGEVEAVLGRHEAVSEAAAVVRDYGDNDERLVCYVVLERQGESVMDELRLFMKNELPPYMIPSAFICLDEMPLTPGGKIDRRALPLPDGVRPVTGREYVAPRCAVEMVLAAIWARILGLDSVGVHDNFFTELGGHSLLATQLVSQVRDTLRVEVPLRLVFEAPSVADFAASLLENPDDRDRVEKTASLVLSVDQIPDEEVEKMLSKRTAFDEKGDAC